MPPTAQDDEKVIDASMATCLWLLFCPLTLGAVPYQTILVLEKEEAVRTDKSICGASSSRRPYGELGSVDKANCLCCVQATSELGEFSPGWGCNEATVDEIVRELRTRMKTRGDTAQIQQSEKQLEKLAELETKIDLIMEHLNIPQPEVMEDR
uniref:Uncharacterized protein n=1 Tax=Helicotheca tamesis TaxID=374047 RepID=A0A7S2ME03_9STRA|mmetsp:Transcript_14426/g.19747  ORF Transcript_14426/g.19747 Transcript_14426/m.19747 type:complete len:153 (+) Transcript_14426:76-534(+)|eukprot:CAMPEP_0185726166 /NCGR_PEP_ID=MMETSP1171-20130828/2227_1 /TAXON_ID=374046 /ORGANISM="Helicotheca tamensis, Strain CCMP826" /LENGTH=152 /DNA_ID=CAMNT_0028394469 /DNA_START=240 /DNA_END=698 /DNA_ORIENTATION=+